MAHSALIKMMQKFEALGSLALRSTSGRPSASSNVCRSIEKAVQSMPVVYVANLELYRVLRLIEIKCAASFGSQKWNPKTIYSSAQTLTTSLQHLCGRYFFKNTPYEYKLLPL